MVKLRSPPLPPHHNPIVEIDPAQRDRIWEPEEKAQEKRLQEQLREQEHHFGDRSQQ